MHTIRHGDEFLMMYGVWVCIVGGCGVRGGHRCFVTNNPAPAGRVLIFCSSAGKVPDM